MMNIYVLQHVAFEGPGVIADWAKARGHPLVICKLYAGERLPALHSFDMLVVMGGSMSVYDAACHAWMLDEIELIHRAIHAGKIVLGICLGAQLIAAALGAKVYPHSVKEIGWFPVTKIDSAMEHPLLSCFPAVLQVLHWHGDTFDLPENAELLMMSEACGHQAFAVGTRVLALQFHLEMDAMGLENMLAHCAADVTDAPTIQSAEIIREGARFIAVCRNVLENLLDCVSVPCLEQEK